MGKLQEIPGVGKNIEQDLINIGIREISDLKGKKPEELYLQDCLFYNTYLIWLVDFWNCFLYRIDYYSLCTSKI